MDSALRPGIRFVHTAIPAAGVILVVILTGLMLKLATGWTAWEMELLRQVNQAHTGPLDALALGLNWLFGPPVASVLVLLGGGGVWLATGRIRPVVRFASIVLIPWLGTEAIKLLVHRARPDIPSLPHRLVLEPGGLSYPSGHTSFAACFALGFIVITAGRPSRAIITAAAVLLALLTAGSRVYLGVHYPSDVIAAIVYSIAAVALVNAGWLLLMTHWDQNHTAVNAPPVPRGASDAH